MDTTSLVATIIACLLGLYGLGQAVYRIIDTGRQRSIGHRRNYSIKYVNLAWHVTHDNQTILTKNWGIEPIKETIEVEDSILPYITLPNEDGNLVEHHPDFYIGSPGGLRRFSVDGEGKRYSVRLKLNYPFKPPTWWQKWFHNYPSIYSLNFTYMFKVPTFSLPPECRTECISYIQDKIGNERTAIAICLPYGYKAKETGSNEELFQVGIRMANVYEVRNMPDSDFHFDRIKLGGPGIKPDASLWDLEFEKLPSKYFESKLEQETIKIIEGGQARKRHLLKVKFKLQRLDVQKTGEYERKIFAPEIAIRWYWEKLDNMV